MFVHVYSKLDNCSIFVSGELGLFILIVLLIVSVNIRNLLWAWYVYILFFLKEDSYLVKFDGSVVTEWL